MKRFPATSLVGLLLLPIVLRAQVAPSRLAPSPVVGAPALLSPSPDAAYPNEKPLTFRWSSVPRRAGIEIRYWLTIAPIFAGQSPKEAIEVNQPLFSRVVRDVSFEYASGPPPFELYPMATGYAWQVQVVDSGGRPLAVNAGKSG
jgi:hypothetical protein